MLCFISISIILSNISSYFKCTWGKNQTHFSLLLLPLSFNIFCCLSFLITWANPIVLTLLQSYKNSLLLATFTFLQVFKYLSSLNRNSNLTSDAQILSFLPIPGHTHPGPPEGEWCDHSLQFPSTSHFSTSRGRKLDERGKIFL